MFICRALATTYVLSNFLADGVMYTKSAPFSAPIWRTFSSDGRQSFSRLRSNSMPLASLLVSNFVGRFSPMQIFSVSPSRA